MAGVPTAYRDDSNDKSNSIPKQSTNPEIDDHSSYRLENSTSAQTNKIKTDYLENLLDSSGDGWEKESMKEKIVPRLQENDYHDIGRTCKNVQTSPHNDDTSNKIQNIEPSITESSMTENISESIEDTENEAISSTSSTNVIDPKEGTSIQNSNIFKQSEDNNIEEVNNSLQLICDYGSDSDSDDDIQEIGHSSNIIKSPEENKKDAIDYRNSQVFFSDDSEEDSDSSDEKSDTSDTSSTTSSSSSSSSTSVATENASALRRNESNNAQNNAAAAAATRKNQLMTKGEIAIEDLPPIEDLFISVPEEECIELGKVTNIVDQLVVVQANKNTPPLDLDSILFLDHGKQTLGQIFDVFGQVNEPLYCIRFNSREHIKERGIERDMIVYCAPKTPHTSYVFIPHLLQAKGSDASWTHNNEPPEKFLDYSDDEEERKAKKLMKSEDKKATTDEGSEHPKKKRIRSNSFERRMNERNLRMTALHANQPPTPTIKNTASIRNNNSTNNNNVLQRPPFDGSAWWSDHRLPPPPPCNPSPQRLIHPPTFRLPPPQRFEIPPYPVFSSPPPPPAFSNPHSNTSGTPMRPPHGSAANGPPMRPPHGNSAAGPPLRLPYGNCATGLPVRPPHCNIQARPLMRAPHGNTAAGPSVGLPHGNTVTGQPSHSNTSAVPPMRLPPAGPSMRTPLGNTASGPTMRPSNGNTAATPPMRPIFSQFQGPPFLPFNHTFPPSIPPFNPSHPPPRFGFPPAFSPHMPRHHPPPPP
ncbi:hypothetical protein L9F63_006307 [Diploptera punctata]|uniref:H/ACA ribonucleoprotein complex non-core subunit NAF1 n=1 Tax=Diploptera punctata TaxID=6984 RepID=A0AAD7ZAI4_DIPPU|nr:hypothetical protein L9F63_006307 [Diploptera punctata]